ncbi:MAG: hypothetical protein JXL84_23710 [Deltaproteobacteria bacterium]|nr:hypothetical protein [Deltaproteobacteria bacterium]
MRELNRSDLSYLLFLVEGQEDGGVRRILGDPFALKWRLFSRHGIKEEKEVLRRLRESEGSRWKRFLDLHLLMHRLLFMDGSGYLGAWLQQEVDLQVHFPGLSWRQLVEARWQAVPVLVVSGNARLLYFIAGVLSGAAGGRLWPPWAEVLMDPEGRSAVETAASAARGLSALGPEATFFCFPLVDPEKDAQIRGSSLGLSLALGFLSVAEKEPLPKHVIASGALADARGAISGVEALEKKALCAKEKGFRVFLYPSCASPPVGSPRLEVVPVQNLQEAWMFSRLYLPGRSRDLMRLLDMFENPVDLVNNMETAEPAWLDWAGREARADDAMNLVIRTPGSVSLFLDKIEMALKQWRLDWAEAAAGLVSSDGFDSMARTSALTALRFATQRIALANHRGDVPSALYWAEKGEVVFEKGRKADLNACADFLNQRFILQHNRHEFAPAFPDELDAILRCLEARYAAQCAGGCRVDRSLGELYGSICQNFGFCGPSFLPECEAYAEKAMLAFGDGEVPDLKEDVLRQYSYLAYARLDAAVHERAREALFRYLGMEHWGQLNELLGRDSLSRWQHAVLTRFLADAGDSPERRMYLDWALGSGANRDDHEHPMQLWFHNLGRIAAALGRRETAETLWERSLQTCLESQLGPTVHVMALLALSGLRSLKRLSLRDLAGAEKQVRESAETLNRDHFALLREKKFEEVLACIWESPERLFPFTYR